MPGVVIYGPLIAFETGEDFVRNRYEVEPEWRRPAEELVTGFERRW